MSSEAAAVMDFLGIENDQRKSAVDRSALHSKIKPQMMQRVLSWRGMLEKPKMDKADANKTMGLFPQTTGFGHSEASQTRILPSLAHSAALPARNAPPLLTIFYNGVVNVFDVDEGKAQAIMTLAESLNKRPTTSIKTFAEESLAAVSPSADPPNKKPPQLRADLPIARKHSLQRFLQKRKDRITSTAPYETALPSKLAKDGDSAEISAPDSALSQPSLVPPVE